MKYKARWSSDEQAEFDQLLTDSVKHGDSTSERARWFATEVDNAADQAHRTWAQEVRADAQGRGFASIYRGEMRKTTLLIQVAGKRIEKPSTISVLKRADDGTQFYQLAFFEALTRQEIAEKRLEYIKQIRAYDSNVQVMDKLTAMLDSAGADDFDTASAILGISVEAWLEGERVA